MDRSRACRVLFQIRGREWQRWEQGDAAETRRRGASERALCMYAESMYVVCSGIAVSRASGRWITSICYVYAGPRGDGDVALCKCSSSIRTGAGTDLHCKQDGFGHVLRSRRRRLASGVRWDVRHGPSNGSGAARLLCSPVHLRRLPRDERFLQANRARPTRL